MRPMIQRITSVVVSSVVLVASGFTVSAQREAARDVIVVFDQTAQLDPYGDEYQVDDRERGNPEAWGYVRREVKGAMQHLERQHGFRSAHAYSHAIRGFAARLSSAQVAALEADPLVAFVEPDGVMAAVAQTTPWGISAIGAAGKLSVDNVTVYVIDTGVDTRHRDLNVVSHVNFAGGQNADCHGHGTHVAGTIAARDNQVDVVGVAPGAPIKGVKVLGCSGSGSTSGVIKGIDFVTADHAPNAAAIANMSLGGGVSLALDDAVRNSVSDGVFYSIAAGNSGADACNSSPARAGKDPVSGSKLNGIMTTAAIDSADDEASWSNYGDCVDIWAPGVGILSTRLKGGTTTMSGTSMAAPHVGGAGARYLSTHIGDSPAVVETQLRAAAVGTAKTSKDGQPIVRLNAAPF